MSQPLSVRQGPQGHKRRGEMDSIFPRKQSRPVRPTFVGTLLNRSMTGSGVNSLMIDKVMIPKLILKNEIEPSSAVFSVEFSDDGRLLLSSHLNQCLRGHDNRTHKTVWTKEGAHSDCCNGCTFINESSFASYSDDKQVKLWDLRNMSAAVKTLSGHTSWVKNVCVVPGGKKLLTSGLDGTIRMFDLNTPSETIESPPLMSFHGLCRMKLAPSGEILVLATWRTTAYTIFDLNLDHLEKDLKRFNAQNSSKPFAKSRNTMKFLHYVPGFRENYSGYSVDISFDESCCVMRHSCPDSDFYAAAPGCSEWVAVYDMQKQKDQLTKDDDEDHSDEETTSYPDWNQEEIPELNGTEIVLDRAGFASEVDLFRARNFSKKVDNYLMMHANNSRLRLNMLFRSWHESSNNRSFCRPQDLHDTAYYKEFDMSAPGIIKEAHFNKSGRLIVSPSFLGFQILAFDTELNSYSHSFKNNGAQKPFTSTELSLVKECEVYADSACLCAKFSPVESMVAVGDQKGRIIWFTPRN